ncbi:aldo/keto reductase (plasmid) [Pseudanabaena biceps]|nr:aldo/keto reductase [Pseudanabaena biceps]
MKFQKLGGAGLEVSALGLGCMGMTWAYSGGTESGAIDTIHRALDLGVNFFDTAEVYSPFTNEEIVGKALRGKRDRAIIATKFGFDISSAGKIKDTNSRPEHIKAVCDASLLRLGVDHIDLLYQHRVDRQVPIEDTVGAMADLVKQGKVLYLGLSEASATTIRLAHKVHPISALQSEWSVWERNLEIEIVGTCRELGIGIVPYCPLGRGFLTGTAKRAEDYPSDDYRRREPRLQGENYDRNMVLVEKLRVIATRHAVTPAQVALAWLLAKGDGVVPIPGTKQVRYLEENVAALSLVLDPTEIADFEEFSTPGAVAGLRYEEAFLASIDR